MGAAVPKLLPASAPRVVILGGGYAGVAVAKKLDESGQFSVLLVDRKSYFLNKPGTVRLTVEKNWASTVMVPYSKLLKNGAFLQAEVDEIRTDSVVLRGYSSPIRFDYLVISLGSSPDFPGRALPNDRSSTLLQFNSVYESVKAASSITIIGGGPTGVEIAGEIGTDFPEKKVRIVHAGGDILADNLKPEFKQKVTAVLKKLKVDIIYNERIVLDEEQKSQLTGSRLLKAKPSSTSFALRTESGQDFQQNLAIFATGTHVANAPLQQNFAAVLNDEGRLNVNEFMQVEGHSNIFALGDIAGKHTKLAFLAGQQGELTGANLLSLKANKKLKAWKPMDKPAAFISLGRKSGYGQFGDSIMGPFIVAAMKSKAFMADKYWSQMNAKSLRGSTAQNDAGVVESGRKEEEKSTPNNVLSKSSEGADIRTKNLQRFVEVNDQTALQFLESGIPVAAGGM